MTTNTLKLINEFLFDGGFAPGIDVDALDQEGALIAAAPDLLAALQWWEEQMRDDTCDDMGKLLDEMSAKARAAIAKATGAN